MFYVLARIIDIVANFLILLIIIDSILSFVMSPLHPLRAQLDGFLDPLLRPIRRIVPLVAGLDFSPLILIILIQVLASALINFLIAFSRI